MKRINNQIRMVSLFLMVAIFTSLFMAGCATKEEPRRTDIKKYLSEHPYEYNVFAPTSDFYINDFANILSEEQKNMMMDKAVQLADESEGIQVVITTVESLSSCTIWPVGKGTDEDLKNLNIEQVSYVMFEQYGIGKDDMGILVLFSVNDRNVRIATGYQMQLYITDSMAGRLLDNYGMQYFKKNQFAEGLVSLQDGIIAEITKNVPENWANAEDTENVEEPVKGVLAQETTDNVPVEVEEKAEKSGSAALVILIVFSTLLVAIVVITILRINKLKRMLEIERKLHKNALNDQKVYYEGRESDASKGYSSSIKQNDEAWEKRVKDLKEQNDAMQEEQSRATLQHSQEVSSLKNQISDLEEKVRLLQEEYDNFKEKYRKIQAIHSDCDFEQELVQMVENEYKVEAAKIDEQVEKACELDADKANCSVFEDAIAAYEGAKIEVAKHLKSNINLLRQKYNTSLELKKQHEEYLQEQKDRADAKEAYDEIVRLTGSICAGTYKDYDNLGRAYDLYKQLSKNAQGFFPDAEMILRIERLYSDAKADKVAYDKAKNAERVINGEVGGMDTATESQREKLKKMMGIYTDLSSASQAYFDVVLLQKIKSLISSAEDDHKKQVRKRKEEAERRRREEEERRRKREEDERRRRMARSSSTHSSSYRSSSGSHRTGGFGGFGGGASGGGASRRF